MLDSKNKVVQNINSFVECDDLVNKNNQLNARYVQVSNEAQKWEQALADTVRCWHNMTEVNLAFFFFFFIIEAFFVRRPQTFNEQLKNYIRTTSEIIALVPSANFYRSTQIGEETTPKTCKTF